MSACKVLLFGNPFLRRKCKKVNFSKKSLNEKMIRDLKDTLHSLQRIHGKGGGLAAPQIGYDARAVYVDFKGRSLFLFNPHIVRKSKSTFRDWDFCFSAKAAFTAKNRFYKSVTVEYFTPDGKKVKEEFSGYSSSLIQHELDHLDGILFTDRMDKGSEIMMMEEWDRRFKYSQDY
ncbi:MAG: peptide deformylase [Candidatus Micrarchaeia archaeon]|jgi:peptide deformylase